MKYRQNRINAAPECRTAQPRDLRAEMRPQMPACDCRDTLLNRLRAIEFAITECTLYLDVYPKAQKALAYYHKLQKEREALRHEYEQQYGPLTQYDNCGDTWEWYRGPWPWEPSAN